MSQAIYVRMDGHDLNVATISICVNRDNVLDAVWLLDDLNNYNYKLNVIFGEREIDSSREFIDLAFKTIVLPETDLFELRNGYYWLKYHRTMTEDLKKKYRSFGILFGIAINNKLTIPNHFPRYFYKKFLHINFDVSDLKIFDPELFSSLTELLKYEIDTELDFSYVDTIRGYEIDLTNFSYMEDSEPAALTESNKADYVSKIVDWVFIVSVKESFAAFEEGYKKVSTNLILYNSFMLDEIDKIVRENLVIDWNALEQSAERRAKEEEERRAKGEAERRAKEEAERRRIKEDKERRHKEEVERRAKEEAERRRIKEDEERRAKEPKYKYNSSNPFNGILNHLNKIYNENIQINKAIEVTSTCLSCGNYETLVDFENEKGHSHISGNPSWLRLDFKNRKLQINSYLIKSAHTNEDSHSLYYLKSWKVEISMNGNEWNTIDERIDDSQLNGNYKMHLFKLNKMSNPFRFIRIFSDQRNWGNSNGFTIGKIELFGNIIE